MWVPRQGDSGRVPARQSWDQNAPVLQLHLIGIDAGQRMLKYLAHAPVDGRTAGPETLDQPFTGQ
jgi:hypothetical protein